MCIVLQHRTLIGFVGTLSFDFQLGIVLFLSVFLGLTLHLTYRSSAKNQPDLPPISQTPPEGGK
jgi:hypothetical protein